MSWELAAIIVLATTAVFLALLMSRLREEEHPMFVPLKVLFFILCFFFLSVGLATTVKVAEETSAPASIIGLLHVAYAVMGFVSLIVVGFYLLTLLHQILMLYRLKKKEGKW